MQDSSMAMEYKMLYGGVTETAKWDHEGRIWYGKIDGICDLITYGGDDIAQLENEFRDAVDDWHRTRSKI